MLDHEMLREMLQLRSAPLIMSSTSTSIPLALLKPPTHVTARSASVYTQNALFKKDLQFASEAAIEFNDEFMEAISYYAKASSELAGERHLYQLQRFQMGSRNSSSRYG